MNGENTLSENIADNGGIKEAYQAYNLYLTKKNKNDLILPGLETFTFKQLFWLTNANLYCTKYNPEYVENGLFDEDHPPNEFRIIGMLSNNRNFAKDFKCPLRSNMNPTWQKCPTW